MKKIVLLLFLMLFYQPVWADFLDGEAAFNAKRYSQAMLYFRPLADEGDFRAQYYVAYLYLNGYGVTKNTELGVEYLQKSLAHNYHLAQALMGFLYAQGEAVPVDHKKAIALYQKAADQGNTSAMLNLAVAYYLGNGVPRNLNRAIELLEKIPIDEQPSAGRYLGDIYLMRDAGNTEAAVRAYYAAAQAGDLPAYTALAKIYLDGLGVEADEERGLKYYKYAAEQGYAPAQYAIGLMYANGRGIEVNPVLGYAWLTFAASQNYEPAVTALNQLKTEMSLADMDRARQEFINLQNNVIGRGVAPLAEEVQQAAVVAEEEQEKPKPSRWSRRRRRR